MEAKPNKDKRIDKVPGHPPIFGDDFKKGNITWKHVNPVPHDVIGRVLVCHLLLEIYIDKFIELNTREFNPGKADLGFSQKIAFVSSHPMITDHSFYDGIVAINKIRNKLAHNLLSEINPTDIKTIIVCIKSYNNKTKRKIKPLPTIETYTEVAIIEFFTQIFCAFVAGACATYVTFTNH